MANLSFLMHVIYIDIPEILILLPSTIVLTTNKKKPSLKNQFVNIIIQLGLLSILTSGCSHRRKISELSSGLSEHVFFSSSKLKPKKTETAGKLKNGKLFLK